MQVETESPGFLFETLYIAAPRSLSPITTVPAEKRLPEFTVVPENEASVVQPATAPMAPATRNVNRNFFFAPLTRFSLDRPPFGLPQSLIDVISAPFAPPDGGQETGETMFPLWPPSLARRLSRS